MKNKKKQCEHDDCRAARFAMFTRDVREIECKSPNCDKEAAAIILDKGDVLYLCYFHVWYVLNEKVKQAKIEYILENLPQPTGEHEKGS